MLGGSEQGQEKFFDVGMNTDEKGRSRISLKSAWDQLGINNFTSVRK